jgi:hypothetical protein
VKGSTLAAIVMVVGVIVLLGGPLVLSTLPAATYWSETQQEALQKASAEAHAATYAGGHDHSQPHAHESPQDAAGKARLAATRAEYERHNARLKAAKSSRSWLGIGCRVLGLLIAAGGLALYVQARRKEP